MMHLDVVLPTYNRHELLRRALRSLLEARIPEGLSVRVKVVDNNSPDATRDTVAEISEAFGGRLEYLLETAPGKSAALNAGIAGSRADLIGLIDDDEEIHPDWYTCIHREFQDPAVDFIGGRCLPRWSQPPPPWLPREFPAVIGWIDQGSEVRRFDDPGFDAMLMGGNAVVRRSLFERAGLYSRVLGPGKTGSGEDYEIYRRFLAAGAEGLYVPDLVVYHHVPAERLRRSYYRQWVFRNGVSLAALDAIQPEPVPRLFGAPRWFVRRGLNGLAQWAIHALLRGPGSPQAFCGQLRFIRLLGFLYAAPRGGLARRAMEHTG